MKMRLHDIFWTTVLQSLLGPVSKALLKIKQIKFDGRSARS